MNSSYHDQYRWVIQFNSSSCYQYTVPQQCSYQGPHLGRREGTDDMREHGTGFSYLSIYQLAAHIGNASVNSNDA